MAASQVIEMVKQTAAVEFEVSPGDLEYRAGAVSVKGSPSFSLSIFEAAALLHPTAARKYGRDRPGLAAEAVFDTGPVVYPCGAHLAVVKVDPETGGATVEQLVLCYDVGRAVNPVLVAGQMEGGALQAVGGALYEQFDYDEDGNPLSASFMDYLLPTLSEAPAMKTLIVEDAPTDTNPLRLKGAGEGGITGVAAAVASAVEHALGRPGLVTSLPIAPEHLTAAQSTLER